MNKKTRYIKNGVNVFRVDKIHNLKIENFIDPEYSLDTKSCCKMSETGLLTVFILNPQNNSKLPSFIARWDQNYETLDVDIKNVSEETESVFKLGKSGYSGHHPKRISEITRTYKVEIKIPSRDVFIGNVTFNINHGHESGAFG